MKVELFKVDAATLPDVLRNSRLLQVLLWSSVALELTVPFFNSSYGLDARFHLYWIEQFTKQFSNGLLIPRWIPGSFYSFGSPTFYFYPPLTLYLASAVRALTGIGDPHVLFQVINFLGTIGSFCAIGILLRALGVSASQLLLASLIYTFAPFRLAEMYHRAALPTHLAYVFSPLFWRGILAIVRREWRPINRILFLGIIASLLTLTDLPVALVIGVCVIVAGVAALGLLRKPMFFEVAVAALLAACLSIFHYAAAISAAQHTHTDVLLVKHPTEGFQWFISGFNWLGDYYMFFTYAPIVLFAGAYWYSIREKVPLTSGERTLGKIGFTLSAVIAFLDFPPTGWYFWNVIPPLTMIAFSLRFYCQLLLLTAVWVGIAASKRFLAASKYTILICSLGALLPAAVGIFNFHIFKHSESTMQDDWAYRPTYPLLKADLDKVLKWKAPFQVHDLASDESFSLLHESPNSQLFAANFDSGRIVTFHRFYWPFWHLYAGHNEIRTYPDSLGRAVATLPAGNYTATWQLERTPLETAGLWISGIAWCSLIVIAGIGLLRKRVRLRVNSSP